MYVCMYVFAVCESAPTYTYRTESIFREYESKFTAHNCLSMYRFGVILWVFPHQLSLSARTRRLDVLVSAVQPVYKMEIEYQEVIMWLLIYYCHICTYREFVK